MYNIHSNYQNILSLIKKNGVHFASLAYLFPFGSTQVENLELITTNNYYPDSTSTENNDIELNGYRHILFLCYDQEPLIYDYNKPVFDEVRQTSITKAWVGVKTAEYGYSKILGSRVHLNELYRVLEYKITTNYYPIILLNTEKNSKEKDKIFEKYDFIDCYYFFHGLAAADWYRGYEYCSDILPISERTIKKKFISFNRITGNARVYRSFFVAELIKRNLLDLGNVSYSRVCPVHGKLEPSLIKAKTDYNLPRDYVQETLSLLNTLPQELRIDGPEDSPISNDSFSIGPIEQSIESFLHVVTETCFWDEKQHLTEKIFKPIVLKQPFVLLGCANNLSYLKEYGFQTFDRWWDESYDQIEDPIQRLKAVCDIIEQICNKSDSELEQLLLEMQEVLDYNYNRFYSKDFVKDIWNELTVNLQAAIAQLPPPTSQGT